MADNFLPLAHTLLSPLRHLVGLLTTGLSAARIREQIAKFPLEMLMNAPINIARRQLLGAVVASAATMVVAPLRATPRPIVVLSSYPDEVLSRFQAAFEQTYPEIRLLVLRQKSADALPYLREPEQNGVDVYWAASPRTFVTLAKEGALRKLDIERTGLPNRLGSTALGDPDGYYVATEMAGYGLALNAHALRQRQLPAPIHWADLADARFAGQIALPSPSKVGFAPPIVEIVLQAHGWDPGWALWSEIAGNATLFDRGADIVSVGVASGQYAVGATIDFFAASALANGAAIEFHYPPQNGVNPAHIAITASAPNPQGALTFVEFVLSMTGQKILAQPDIGKLPVRPAVYRDLPYGQFDPFAAAAHWDFVYDADAARPRMALTTAIFEQFLTAAHDDLAALWARVHRAEAAGKPVAAARGWLSLPPISESDAANTMLRQVFRSRLQSQGGASAAHDEASWRATSERNRREAKAVLDRVGA